MIAILAEKPAVAQELANIVGAKQRHEGWFEGGGYAVTWAIGHMLKLTCPEDGSPWVPETLPLLPQQFMLVPRKKENEEKKEVDDPKLLEQLKVIEKLFNSAEYIIAATDAGREGQLIFEYIYSYVGCTKPVKRLWISSLTEEAMREGMENLYDNKEFFNLYLSAACRAQADWLVGINATRALTICGGGSLTLSMGRVQTPALCMIAKRYVDFVNFEPDPYWTVKAVVYKGVKTFKVRSSKKFKYSMDAETLKTQTRKQGQLTVRSFKKEVTKRNPPRLYSTAKIQEEASSRYEMTAKKTKDVLQSLYAKHKVLTYPRTDTRYIPDDVFRTVPRLLQAIRSWKTYTDIIDNVDPDNLNRNSVDQLKITDHHALIPTGMKPNFAAMTKEETLIFGMIVERFIEAFGPQSETEKISVVMENEDGYTFEASGKILIKAGWRGVKGEEDKDEEFDEFDNQPIPDLTEGEKLKIIRCETNLGQTKAPSLYTDGSMVHAMKYAGRNAEDENVRRALRDVGLGTADTRDSEIEMLIKRQYIVRDEERHLIPTKLGIALYMTLKDQDIANIAMTGKWEGDLMSIADGETDPYRFDNSIREYVKHGIIEEIFDPRLRQRLITALDKAKLTCPYCGEKMENRRNDVSCKCGFRVYKTIYGKTIDEFVIEQLVEEGETDLLKGFIDSKGKKYSARLIRTHDKQVKTKRTEKGGFTGKK